MGWSVTQKCGCGAVHVEIYHNIIMKKKSPRSASCVCSPLCSYVLAVNWCNWIDWQLSHWVPRQIPLIPLEWHFIDPFKGTTRTRTHARTHTQKIICACKTLPRLLPDGSIHMHAHTHKHQCRLLMLFHSWKHWWNSVERNEGSLAN